MKRVLILDDNPQNNKKYIDRVRQGGRYVVDVTMKIVSAERMLRNNRYDYVVIDVMMPTQNLSSNDEMSTGFVFYRDVVKEMGLHSKIIFWSRLEETSFDNFWEEKPAGVTFVHKSQAEDHLRAHIDDL